MRAEPVYETFEGWDEDIAGVRRAEDLPSPARRYVDALEELAGIPIGVVSVGADRNATIFRRERPRRPTFGGPAAHAAGRAGGAREVRSRSGTRAQ
jgi:hypothetical protein